MVRIIKCMDPTIITPPLLGRRKSSTSFEMASEGSRTGFAVELAQK